MITPNTKKHPNTLDTISGCLFLIGSLTIRLKIIPIFILQAILNLVSLLAYLLGYLTWSMAAFLYPDHPRQRDMWYGFAQFKEQYQIAALLGAIAAIATIGSIIIPPLIIPTTWLYTLSNIMWSISEHHKNENPPLNDDQFSSTKQALYLRYALLITTISTLTAISTTIAAICPAAAFITITSTTAIGITLGAAFLYHLGKYALSDQPSDNINHSYDVFSKQLSFTLNKKPTPVIAFRAEPRIENRYVSADNVTRMDEYEYNPSPTSSGANL